MSLTVGDAILRIEGDHGPLAGALGKAEGMIGGWLGNVGGLLKTGIGAALGVAAAGIGAGVAGLGAGLAISIGEALESEQVQAQLLARIKSTGGVAGVTAEMANEVADSLSRVTRFGDEAILSGQNLLLTFTGIGKDVFPDATKTMLDMSTAMGQDLKASALQLGKALNNPVEGISALTRVGVKFTAEQEKQIKAMVAAGDVAGAQRIILAELQTEFGGAAEAAGNTAAGKWDIFKNSLLNTAEAIGLRLLPLGQRLFDNFLLPMANLIESKLVSNLPAIALRFKNLGGAIGELLSKLAGLLGLDFSGFDLEQFLHNLVVGFLNAVRGVEKFVDGLTAWLDSPEAAGFFEWLETTRGQLEGLAGSILEKVGPALDGVKGFLADIAAIVVPAIMENLTKGLEALQAIWDEHGDKLLAVGGWLLQLAGVVLFNTADSVVSLATALLQLIAGDWEGSGETFNNWFERFANNAAGLVGMDWAGVQASWQGVFELLGIILTVSLNNMSASLAAWLNQTAADIGAGAANISTTWQTNLNLLDVIAATVLNNISATWASNLNMLDVILKTVLNNMSADLTKWLNDAAATVKKGAKDMVTAGAALMDGLKQGIAGKLGEVLAYITGVGTQIKDAFLDAINYNSPPPWSIEAGSAVMQGLAQGMTGAIRAPELALGNLVPSLSAAALGGFGSINTGTSIGTQVSFTQQNTVRDNLDIEQIAYRVVDLINQRRG